MASKPVDPKPCAFGAFVFDPTNRRLLRDGLPVPITARVFDILSVLIQHAGEPLDKDRLVRLVWGDVSVEEGNLARNVSTLRRLLGEHPDDHRYIVTLPGRGYQFVAEIRPLGLQSGGRHSSGRERRRRIAAALGIALAVVAGIWLARRDRSHPPSRVAVLPFKTIGVSDDDSFSLGMTEEITTRLSAARDLRVISRTTADKYRQTNRTAEQIGADLGVDYLLEGSVRPGSPDGRPQRLRVTAQLIRVADDTHLWSETYDRELADVFEVQSEIARRVVIELRGALAPEDAHVVEPPPTHDLEAYRAYARGVFFTTVPNPSEANLTRVVAEFQRAVDLDPQFALAYAALARAHEGLYRFGYDISDERKQLAARALERAEALAPESPRVLLARSQYASTIGKDTDGALRAAQAAERVRPNDAAVAAAAAGTRLAVGRWTEAAASYERSVQLDPRRAGSTAVLGLIYVALRRHADAELAIDRSIAIEPDQVLANVVRVWNTWLWRGDVPGARAQLDRQVRFDDWRFMELRFLQSLYERRFDRARAALVPFAGQWMRDWVLTRPVVLFEAQAWRLEGDLGRARATFEQARALLEAEAVHYPADGRIRGSLAVALAGLDRKEEARREARLALASMPHPQGFDTAAVREDAALALTMIGDEEAALAELAALLRQPAFFTPHLLRLDPRWEPLRKHPRYRALAETGAPGS
jgi:TolB-like protein/DNA-binding winged helix-turn-helix (wHTH) protein/tetratricopeptide (TPR) repeat protein